MRRTDAIIVGSGGMARWHIRSMLKQRRTTRIVGVVEVSESQRQATRTVFEEHKLPAPPFYATIRDLARAQGPADAAFVCTPHKFHFENTRDCLRLGMDVLLEKPMVMDAAEARRLIRVRDRTNRLLVVAFPGSLAPAVWKARDLIARGEIGRVNSLMAVVYQGWKTGTTGTWRQDPVVSGGGFLFDTGSHLVNTSLELMGGEVDEVTALFDNRGAPVEINAAVTGRSRSGIQFSMTAAGDCIRCTSQILVFGDRGVLETGVWGERLRVLKAGEKEFQDVPVARSRGVWDIFVRVREGRMPNPCPAEVGLRFAMLMDAIRASAASGRAVRVRRRGRG
jgi:predicted dehydrogenase